MATLIQQVIETTNTGSTGLGFSFPKSGNSVFNPTYTTRDVVRTNLINWLLTNKGERVFRPNFGANLRELIFEGITEGSNSILEERITNTIAEEFPMVTVVKTQFIRLEDQYTINFILEYKIMNMDTVDELNIQLNG